MSGKKRNRRARLLAGAAVLLVLVAVLVVAQKKSADYEASESSGSGTLMDLTADRIKSIAYTKTGSDEVAFTRSEGQWSADGDAAFPVDQTKANTLASTMTGVSVTKKMENVRDPAQYGLDKPSYTVQLTDTDGKKTMIAVGSVNDTTNDVYVYLNDDSSTVYAVSTGLLTDLDYDLSYFKETSDSGASSAAEAALSQTEPAVSAEEPEDSPAETASSAES